MHPLGYGVHYQPHTGGYLAVSHTQSRSFRSEVSASRWLERRTKTEWVEAHAQYIKDLTCSNDH